MSHTVDLLVSLKIPDVTAITARRVLQRRMGYQDSLASLTRADWWRVTTPLAGDAALALGRQLAEETTLFVNPNKHVYQLVLDDAWPADSAASSQQVRVVTGFYDDATAALKLQALRGRLGFGDSLAGLELGTLWTFGFAVGDAAKARELAEQITASTRREAGLLTNPHSMWWRFIEPASQPA